MRILTLFLFFVGCVFASNAQSFSHKFSLENKSSTDLIDYTVELPLSSVKNIPLGSYVAFDGEVEVPVEMSSNLLGETFLIFPVSRLKAKEKKTFYIRSGNAITYPKRTYAEITHKVGGEFEGNKYVGGYSWVKPNYLRVLGSFRDHAYYIKYEGPGWESDKVAFRFYLDQRNGIDVFAKKVPGIVLPAVGVDGYDNYHKMDNWGMDNARVGKSLGLGSIAIWDGSKAIRVEERDSAIAYIQQDGKVRSQVNTTFYGWNANGVKCNLQSLISIDAGSRASHMELKVDKAIDNITTGIIINKNAEYRHVNGEKWSYIATFGKQSMNDGDIQGLVIFYRTKQLISLEKDSLNHLVVLKPVNGYVDYYFMPTWELDWEPVVTEADFQRCIDEVLARLNFK